MLHLKNRSLIAFGIGPSNNHRWSSDHSLFVFICVVLFVVCVFYCVNFFEGDSGFCRFVFIIRLLVKPSAPYMLEGNLCSKRQSSCIVIELAGCFLFFCGIWFVIQDIHEVVSHLKKIDMPGDSGVKVFFPVPHRHLTCNCRGVVYQ